MLDLEDGSTLRVVITATQDAGHLWFEKNNNADDIIIAGPDWVDHSGQSFVVEFNDNNRHIFVLSPQPFHTPAGFIESTPYNQTTQTATFFNGDSILQPAINPQLLSSGKSKSDREESNTDYDSSHWHSWTGTPNES